MIPPHIIKTLQKDYESRLSHYNAPALALEAQKEEPVDLETSKLILDADDLWRIIEPQLASSQFYSICVSGQQGSGKTSVGRELLSKAEAEGYVPLFSSGEDLATFALRGKQEAKGAKKVAILFDDMSYVMNMMGGKTQGAVKNFIGKIRHYFKAKLFIIYNVHIFTGIPPIFRNTSEWIFSKPSMLEFETIMALSAKEPESKEETEIMVKNVMDLQEQLRLKGEVNFTFNKHQYRFVLGTDEQNTNDGRLMLLMSNGTPYFYRAQLITDKSLKSYAIGLDVKVNTDIFKPKEEKGKGGNPKPAREDPEDLLGEDFEEEPEEDTEPEETEEETEEVVEVPAPQPVVVKPEINPPKPEKVKVPKTSKKKETTPVEWDEQKKGFYENLKKLNPTLSDDQIREMIALSK